MRPLFVFDNIHSPRRAYLFTMVGVRVEATRYAWLAPITWLLSGLLVAAVGGYHGSLASFVGRGAVYGAALYLSNVLHSLGHITAGRLVGAPMGILLLTSTRDVTLYQKDSLACPARLRVSRSLGGPITNIAVALLFFVSRMLLGAPWLALFAVVNLAVGLWTLCPIPTMDGWVIWRGLFSHRT